MAEFINANGTVPQSTGGLTPITISSSTNATPIVVTFSGSHNANEGDTWEIDGHAVNTNANGTWQVHVVSGTQLQLNNSVGNGVGAATGYGINYSVNPLLQVPDDGDLASGANTDTMVEGVFNTIPYLYQRVGKYRLHDIYEKNDSTQAVTSTPWSQTSITSASTWTTLTNASSLLTFSVQPVVLSTDILEVHFRTSVNMGGTIATIMAIGIAAVDVTLASTAIALTSVAQVSQYTTPSPVTLYARLNPGFTSQHAFNFTIQGWANNTTSVMNLFSSYSLLVNHYRVNS